MIKSKVTVVTTGFLGLLSSSALAVDSDFTTNGKVIKFSKEDGKVLGKVSSKDFKNNNIKTNGNFRGVFKKGFDVENVDYNNPVNSAVGLLHNDLDDSFYMGSGMFISPTVFVTVAHNFLQPNGVNQLNKDVRQYNLILGSNSKANGNRVTSGISYLYPPQTIKFWNKDGFSLKPSEVEGNTRKSDGALVGGANIQWFNDLAVLTFDKPMQLMSPYKMADFNELASDEEFNSIREGDKVNVLGYSSDFDKSDDPLLENKLEHGKLYKISGAIQGYIDPTTGKTYDKFVDKNGNLVDNPNKSVFYNYITSRGGLSGAGVLNNKNHVIGLHQFALDGKYHAGHEKAGESVPDSDPSNKQAGGIIFTKEQRDWLRQMIEQNKITGWYEDSKSGERYFFKDDGHMLRNTTKIIDGVSYHFNAFGVAQPQTEVAKKQGSIRVKYIADGQEVLPSKVVVSGDVGTKYSYSTVNDNELMELLQKGKYELVESIREEGVLSEGEHVINVTVRLKTANLSEINQTIKSVESFLNGKKEIHTHHPFADDFNNGINDLTKLIRDTKSALNGGASQEVVDNMNKILSEKLWSVKLDFDNMFHDFVAERANAADEIKEVLKVKRDVSNLSSDEVTKLEKLLKDVAEASRDMYNVNYGEVDLLADKVNIARTKLNELKAYDAKLSKLGAEQVEKDKLIKEWDGINLGTIKGVSSNLETEELRVVKAQISELSKDLNVSSNDSLEVIKTKLSNKKALSELIVKNNKLVDKILAKGSVGKEDKKDESSVKVDDKADKKDNSSVKDDSNPNKKDKSDNKKESSVKNNSNVVDKPKDNEVHEGNKVDEKVKEDRPDNSVDGDSSKGSSESHKEKGVTKPSEDKKVDNEYSKVTDSKKDNDVTKPSEDKKVSDSTEDNKVDDDSKISEDNKSIEGKSTESTEVNKVGKVGEDSKVSDEVNDFDGNKVSEDSKVSDEAKSNEGNKVSEDSKVSEDAKSTEGNKVSEDSKVSDEAKSTEGNNVGEDTKSTESNKASLNDIIRSKTPEIEEIQELDLDIKYTKRMVSDDINIQKIKDFNDKIPAKFTEVDSNINFIKTFLSKLINK